MTNQFCQSNDEIDFNKLFATLVKHKLLIFTITAIITMSAAIYAWISPPIYSGQVLIEVGEIILNGNSTNNKPTIIKPLDTINDFTQVLMQTFDINDKLTIESPQNSDRLIKISYENVNKKIIQKKLEQITLFTLKRHQQKANFFQQTNAYIHPSMLISTIKISPNPVKPKKQLIVVMGLIGGLLLSLLLIFVLEFIQTINDKRSDSD